MVTAGLARRADPADVCATHRLEIELNSCMLNPREYERQTLAELARITTGPTG